MDLPHGLKNFIESGTKVYIPEERYAVDLSLSENPLGFSPHVLAAIDREKNHVGHYPDPHYRDLCNYLAESTGLAPHNFIFGAGADGLIENLVRILINPGEKALMPDLTFLNAAFATTIASGIPVYAPMKADFHIDFEAIKSRVEPDTKIIFICNPNNPTGLIESPELILDLARSTQAYVIVDEANIEFGGESVLSQVNEVPNLIVLRTLSKGYGLAGLRIGYCAGNKELMEYVWRLRPPFAVDHLAQVAALAALQDREHIASSKNYVKQEKTFLQEELNKRGIQVIPSEGNCFLAKVTPLFESSTLFNDLLHSKDATVVDGKFFRGLGNDYVRIAPQKHESNLRFLEIVDELLK